MFHDQEAYKYLEDVCLELLHHIDVVYPLFHQSSLYNHNDVQEHQDLDYYLLSENNIAVVYAEILTNLSSGMNVNSGKWMCKFCDYAGQDRYTKFKKTVSHTVMIHCNQWRIAKDYLFMANGSGVPVKNGLYISAKQASKLRYAFNVDKESVGIVALIYEVARFVEKITGVPAGTK